MNSAETSGKHHHLPFLGSQSYRAALTSSPTVVEQQKVHRGVSKGERGSATFFSFSDRVSTELQFHPFRIHNAPPFSSGIAEPCPGSFRRPHGVASGSIRGTLDVHLQDGVLLLTGKMLSVFPINGYLVEEGQQSKRNGGFSERFHESRLPAPPCVVIIPGDKIPSA